QRGPLPVGEASRVVLHVCAALRDAHDLGIVHRDVKPENVFLRRRDDGTEQAKLLDFGISKLIGDAAGADQVLTGEGMITGTPGFMAPEQVTGAPVAARTDVWAVGLLLYGLLAGRFPFAGKKLNESLVSILWDDPPPPSQYAPEIPPELDRLVLRC